MKNILTETRIHHRLNSGADEAKDQIRDLEYKKAENIHSEKQKRKGIQKKKK